MKWIEVLEFKTKELIDDGYTVNSAMYEAWNDYYGQINKDCDILNLSIREIRESFWRDSFDDLEAYEEEIINRY